MSQHYNPDQFSVEVRVEMARKLIKKHDVAMVTLHWFNALVWFFELMTGMALIASTRYTYIPSWFTDIIVGIFNGRTNLLYFHITIGVFWSGILVVYGVFGIRTYLTKFYVNDLRMDGDDFKWLVLKPLQILGYRIRLPEQGVYNAGQKVFAWVISICILLIIPTGFIMSFHLGPLWLIQWSIPLHYASVMMVVAGLIVHVYMAGLMPEERPAFFSMLHGKVNELYAYENHTKWWRQRRKDEERFLEELSQSEGWGPLPRGKPRNR